MPETPRRQIFLGNVHYDATEDDIRKSLSTLGIAAGNVRIVTDKDTGRSKGFAFVDLAESEALGPSQVIDVVNGQGISLRGRRCRADEVRVQPRSTPPSPHSEPHDRHDRRRRRDQDW